MEKAPEMEVLRGLSVRAVHEFEELQGKCKEFYSKYSHAHDQNQKLQSQFKQLKRVSLLAVSEYENLMKRYTDEVKSKEEIKSKLKKVEEENKELRKSNKMAPNVAIIPANSRMGSSEGASKGELEGLRSLLTGMKEEMRRTKSDFTKIESQLEDEKRDHESTKHKLKIGNAQVQQLNKVSVMALDEFQDLRKKHELEVECRRKAEEYASQLLHNQQSEARISRVITENPNKNNQLESAFKEVEELNKTLAKERSEYDRKVKNLTEELDSCKDNTTVKALDEKMTVALDQIELLQSQLQESESRAQHQERRARELQDKLLRTEAAMASGGSMVLPAHVPAPPPPPPPPPMPAPMIRKFITRIGGGKKKKGDKAPEKDDPIQDMMKEMMARIHKGVGLKSKNQANQDEKSPAMNELADLLTNLKRGQSGSQERSNEANKKGQVPEFQQFKLRKISAEPPKVAEKKSKKDNELMKKLEKQKHAAENEGMKIEEREEPETAKDGLKNSNQTDSSSKNDHVQAIAEVEQVTSDTKPGDKNNAKEQSRTEEDANTAQEQPSKEEVGGPTNKETAPGRETVEPANTEPDSYPEREESTNQKRNSSQSLDSQQSLTNQETASDLSSESIHNKMSADAGNSAKPDEETTAGADLDAAVCGTPLAEEKTIPPAETGGTEEKVETSNVAAEEKNKVISTDTKGSLDESFDAIFDEINEFL